MPCLAESSGGCNLGSASTFHAHQRAEKLRIRLDLEGLDDLAQATQRRTMDPTAPARPSKVTSELPVKPNLDPSSSSRTSSQVPDLKGRKHRQRSDLDVLIENSGKDLIHIRDQYIQANLSYTATGPLDFVNNPVTTGEFFSEEASTGVNSGRHALNLKSSANRAFLQQETTLLSLVDQLDAVMSHDQEGIRDQRKILVKKIKFDIAQLDRFKAQEWERQRTHNSGQDKILNFDVDTGMLVCSSLMYR